MFKFLRVRPSDRKRSEPKQLLKDRPLHPDLNILLRPDMPKPATMNEIGAIAKSIDVPRANLLTVIRQESSNAGFVQTVAGVMPKPRLELHKLHEYTEGVFADERPDLFFKKFSLKAGNVSPDTHLQRMSEAMYIVQGMYGTDLVLEATSWGLGQIMGFNYRLAGYGTPDRFVAAMAESEVNQIKAMTTFIENVGIRQALADRDWRTFARNYNGSARVDEYSRSLAAHYRAITGRSLA